MIGIRTYIFNLFSPTEIGVSLNGEQMLYGLPENAVVPLQRIQTGQRE
jgi:hypothetical protein